MLESRHRSATDQVPYEGAIINPTHYLESVNLDPDDSDDDAYEDILNHEEFQDLSDSDAEETLEKAIRSMTETVFLGNLHAQKPEEKHKESLTKRPEVVDDYIRNYFSSKGLMKSLDAFQNEWYELQQKGSLSPEDRHVVSDVYIKSQELADSLQKLRIDVENYKEIANKARATYDKLRKERDFHRMHHKRVVQEKNRLIGDIKRLKKHYEAYEPTLKSLRNRYEIAMKEKMLMKLERDRVLARLTILEGSGANTTTAATATVGGVAGSASVAKNDKLGKEKKNASSGMVSNKTKGFSAVPALPKKAHGLKESILPIEDRPNIYANMELPVGKIDRLKQIHSINAHNMAVSSIKFHPKKMILATVSDDKFWKMWAFPSGELIMSGEGHKDWIADCDFHPKGAHLATASGDGTVKIWDFGKGLATLTLSDHTQAVWACTFHDQGDFLASCSMDHTAKLWDINTGKCRQTFRGHADSVNHVGFIPFTNTLYTCSGDKTLSLWDARTGLCSQTLYGHMNAINHVSFSLKGDTVASCDTDGIVKFWDIRNVSELNSIDFGPHSANKLAFDPSGNILAVASNDGLAKT
ncbi:Sperm-associated antigen 16 protein [Physocladia obscura]|uniref:Sperm-associated antigen 16 protein n=1 Tax=Physocladia obscura TaxID=109957 RepID=A0AAD5XGZ9_9FUNG|nr:Sperm-associated antigen 16 protein [Physocladia obscura]